MQKNLYHDRKSRSKVELYIPNADLKYIYVNNKKNSRNNSILNLTVHFKMVLDYSKSLLDWIFLNPNTTVTPRTFFSFSPEGPQSFLKTLCPVSHLFQKYRIAFWQNISL